MREQFWGLVWSLSVRALGPHHRVSLALESKWSAAYWATRPPLSIGPCTKDCAIGCPRRDL